MSDWDYGRCKSLLEEVQDGAQKAASVFEAHGSATLPVRVLLSDVDQLFNALRKVKALLVRDRKSKA